MIIAFITDIKTIGNTITILVKAFIDLTITIVIETITNLLVRLFYGYTTLRGCTCGICNGYIMGACT
tara:strand:- start:2137 stop:2337 length:201 start_codon:yes stop_codon:yes gene_type:complete